MTTEMQLGLALKAQGQATTEEHNEGWVALMRSEARRLGSAGSPVSTDQLREFAARVGATPKHPAAWGTVFRRDEWQVYGMKISERPEARGRMIRTWILKRLAAA